MDGAATDYEMSSFSFSNNSNGFPQILENNPFKAEVLKRGSWNQLAGTR